MKRYNTPKISLVGAGPGDLELITVKGLNALKSANVILYDALVNKDLLDYAPIAKKLFVGKRKGYKAFSQDEINNLLVESALKYGHAVRLKGGDSFVFGRGFEEMEFARNAGVETEVIPGISSSIAVPALAGVSVTHRKVSNSFHVISGTLANGELNPEIKHAALGSGTVVVLMGLSKITDILNVYKKVGKHEVDVAIISNGSLPNQESIFGKVHSIEARYFSNPIPAPAVIVLGDVVGYADKQAIRSSASLLELA